MRKGQKKFLLLAGPLMLILASAAVLYFSAARIINSETVKDRIRAALFDKTGAHVSYSDSDIHLLPHPEVNFHNVRIAVPGKAEGAVEAVRIYPSLWSLLKGNVGIAKISLEAPHFLAKLSEKDEKISLEQIEERLRSAVQYIVTKTPGAVVIIRGGQIEFVEADKIAFSFTMIQSKLNASQKAVTVELTCRSNLYEELSLSILIEADDLKSAGTVKVGQLRPDLISRRLSQETARQMATSAADLSVKFEAVGLKALEASFEASASELAISRGKRSISLGDGTVQGDISVRPDTVSVRITEAKISRPALNVSGNYRVDRATGSMAADLETRSLAVRPVREAALAFWGDLPLIDTIFSYLQAGEVPVLHLHAEGGSLKELGRTENIRISGTMQDGTIYVAAKDLTFHHVAGEVDIRQGILNAADVKASLEDHRCSKGRLRIGLKGKDAPFHVELRVQADASQLPSLLKEKRLIPEGAILHEMDRIRDLTGSVEGSLKLGDRLDDIHVKIAVDTMDIKAGYDPLPFPLAVTKGRFFFDEKTVGVADSAGSLGQSSFSGLTARLSLTDPYDLEITGGQLAIFADEIYPWIASFEETRPVLAEVRSLNGMVSVSSVNLRGPLYQPGAWQFRTAGEAKGLALDAAFFPGKVEDMHGAFGLTQNELSLKNVHARFIDSLLTVSGVIREFPSDIKAINLSLKGEIGQGVAAWVAELAHLPPQMKLRAPFSVTDAAISLEKDSRTAFSGRFVFDQKTQVSLMVTKTPDAMDISELTIKDRTSDLVARIKLSEEAVEVAFKGNVTSQALKGIFADSIFADASLKGDFRTHVFIDRPQQSSAEGRLEGSRIAVPWGRDIPLVLQHVVVEAEQQEVVIKTADVMVGNMSLKATGTISKRPSWLSVDMDLSSNGIDWMAFERILRKDEHSGKKKAEDSEGLPVRGQLRLRSDFFHYHPFRWEPFHADISFDGRRVLIAAREAALCGISTTGTVAMTEQGLKLDVTLSAKDREFRPTILCLTSEHADYTGTFQMEARLKGEGTIDEIARRLDGTFTLSAKDGKILKSESLDKTLDLLNKSENFKGQFPDLDREIISYTLLKIRGAVREHILQIEEGIMESAIMEIMARGHLDLHEEAIDLNALVAPLKTVNQVMRNIPVVGYILGGNLVSVPVKISGNIKDPEVTFLSPSAIGSEFLGILERTIKLPVRLVEPIFSDGKDK